jgi:hypothetical protein
MLLLSGDTGSRVSSDYSVTPEMTVHFMKSCLLEYNGALSIEDKSGSKLCLLFHAGILLGIFFDPKNGDGMFLRNVG